MYAYYLKNPEGHWAEVTLIDYAEAVSWMTLKPDAWEGWSAMYRWVPLKVWTVAA